jgi:hypothetical protein
MTLSLSLSEKPAIHIHSLDQEFLSLWFWKTLKRKEKKRKEKKQQHKIKR